MEPREYVETVATLTRAAASLAVLDPTDLPATLAADSVAALAHAVRVADNALALITRRVQDSGIWAERGDRSAAAWVMRTTGSSYAQARDHLDAAGVCEQHTEFAVGFRTGATGVAHLTHVHRELSGPGLVKAQRRAHFPAFATALATAAAEADPATYGRVLTEWTDAVDHAPVGRDADARAHRYLVFAEIGDQCLIEGALPLAEDGCSSAG